MRTQGNNSAPLGNAFRFSLLFSLLILPSLSREYLKPFTNIQFIDLNGNDRFLQNTVDNYEASIDAEQKRIASNTPGRFVPIRIAFEVTEKKAEIPIEDEDLFKNRLFPEVSEYLKNTLKVFEGHKNPLVFPNETCLGTPVVGSHKTTGVSDMDLVIYVSFFSDINDKGLAYSTGCILDTQALYRPVFGTILVNAAIFNSKKDYSETFKILLHEVMHVMGFNPYNFGYFVSPTGKTLPMNEIGGFKVTYGSEPYTVLVLDQLLTYAKEYFNCINIKGVPLENSGSDSSINGHWESWFLPEDIMVGSSGRSVKVSKFTLKLFESSGWYIVNYDQAEVISDGLGAGCDYFNLGCQAAGINPNYCNDQSQNICSPNYLQKSYCTNTKFSQTCSLKTPYQKGNCFDFTSNSELQSLVGEIYGPSSNCFESNIKKESTTYSLNVRCFQASECNYDSLGKASFTISISGIENAFVCDEASANMELNIASSDYSGFVRCPDVKKFCQRKKENCNGKCWNGICLSNGGCYKYKFSTYLSAPPNYYFPGASKALKKQDFSEALLSDIGFLAYLTLIITAIIVFSFMCLVGRRKSERIFYFPENFDYSQPHEQIEHKNSYNTDSNSILNNSSNRNKNNIQTNGVEIISASSNSINSDRTARNFHFKEVIPLPGIFISHSHSWKLHKLSVWLVYLGLNLASESLLFYYHIAGHLGEIWEYRTFYLMLSAQAGISWVISYFYGSFSVSLRKRSKSSLQYAFAAVFFLVFIGLGCLTSWRMWEINENLSKYFIVGFLFGTIEGCFIDVLLVIAHTITKSNLSYYVIKYRGFVD